MDRWIMKISECCGAEIILSDICSECKEHCDEEVAHKINSSDVKLGFLPHSPDVKEDYLMVLN